MMIYYEKERFFLLVLNVYYTLLTIKLSVLFCQNPSDSGGEKIGGIGK